MNPFGFIMFFIPGILLTEIFFLKEEKLFKFLTTVLLSISFFTFLGIFLGYTHLNKMLTGGLSGRNVWLYSIVFTFIIFLYLLKERGYFKDFEKKLKKLKK